MFSVLEKRLITDLKPTKYESMTSPEDQEIFVWKEVQVQDPQSNII